MSHPSLFASPMLPIVNPEILGIARFIFIFYLCSHMSLDDVELSWLSANLGENNYWLISINYAN